MSLRSYVESVNGRYHRIALAAFLVIVVAHWAEHLAQAAQIYLLGWPIPEARGVLGLAVPWLVTSEWLHYGYALVMLAGLLLLRKGFTGTARRWWNASLAIQIWHHFEHLILLLQVVVGANLLGRAVPTSIIQLLVPRVELHLFYNAIVFVPMVVAMVLHRRAHGEDLSVMQCTCAMQPMPSKA